MSDDASKTGSDGSKSAASAAPKAKSSRSKTAAKDYKHALNVVAAAFVGRPGLWLDVAPDIVFSVLADASGLRRIIVIDKDKVVRAVSDDFVDAAVSEFVEAHVVRRKKEFIGITPTDFAHIRQTIKRIAVCVPEESIAPIACKSSSELTYHRLPWDLDSSAPCPTFDELFNRMTNAEAVMAFIGSLFDPKSNREQFPFIVGDGQNGKGRLIQFLMDTLGPAATPASVPSGDSAKRFFTAGVYDKRLVCFGECDDFTFATSPEMKALTGDDIVAVDQKGQAIYRARAICKLMFVANTTPSIERIEAHRRRIIYSEIGPITGPLMPTHRYDALLRDEGHAFLSRCWDAYRELASDGGAIEVSAESHERLLAASEADFEEVVQECCVLSPDVYAVSGGLVAALKASGIPAAAKKKFLRFLKAKYGVMYGNEKTEGLTGQKKGFWGIAVKNSVAGISSVELERRARLVGTEDEYEQALAIINGGMKGC